MRRFSLVAIAASLLLSVAACGDDDEGTPDSLVLPPDSGIVDARLPPDSRPAPDAMEAELSCQGIFGCWGCCPDSDTGDCIDACYGAASSTGQAAFDAFMGCVSESCGTECGASGSTETCLPCVAENCGTEQSACGFEGDGTGNCAAAISCWSECEPTAEGTGNAETCPLDEGLVCTELCWRAASQAEVDQFMALNECINVACETACAGTDAECTACVQESIATGDCADEMTACQQ